MTTLHDTAVLLPNGNHPNYRPYDAIAGRETLHTGRKYACVACGKQFFTREDRDRHQHLKHGESE